MKIENQQKGFTLLEILMTLGVLAILLTVVLLMFSSILKSSAKTRIMNEVKQNGSYAMNVMSRAIRNAKAVEVFNDHTNDPDIHNGHKIEITNIDGSHTYFYCTNNVPSGIKTIAQGTNKNGPWSPIINSTQIKAIDGEDGPGTNYCDFMFYHGESTGYPNKQTVRIVFVLSDASGVTSGEDLAKARFDTSIVLRNYQ